MSGQEFSWDHSHCPHPSRLAVFCHATLNTSPSKPCDKRSKTELADQVAFKSHLLIPRDLFWIHRAQTKADTARVWRVAKMGERSQILVGCLRQAMVELQ